MSSHVTNTDAVLPTPALRNSLAAAPAHAHFAVPETTPASTVITVDALSMSYGGDALAIQNISLDIRRNRATAFIGPSGCGKSTLLRCFNRLNDLILSATGCRGRDVRSTTKTQEGGMTWRQAVLVATIGATLLLTSSQARAQCEGDIDGDNQVTVDEIISAVNNALSGCAPPVSIRGVYEGPGYEIHTGCNTPGDEGTFEHPQITTDIDEQTGSLYTGTLTLRRAGGQPFVQTIEGSVDSAGITQGVSFIPGVPVPAGHFSGRLVGKILTISVTINDPTCASAAASFIGTRD